MRQWLLKEVIQSVKCSSCHKLTDERLVGPGWKGVTNRQKPGLGSLHIDNLKAFLPGNMMYGFCKIVLNLG